MTAREFRERLQRRLQKNGAPIPDATRIAQLEAYFFLLVRWNAKINLTALPLDRPADETFDRLFVEPLAAARHLPSGSPRWFDLGTGGGSPALPLKIVSRLARLTMIESKARKAAFLREVVRTLELPEASVENARFEEVALRYSRLADVITVRAVRPDSTLFNGSAQLAASGCRLMMFRPDAKQVRSSSFAHVETVPLLDSRTSYLVIYKPTFHVEHVRLTSDPRAGTL